MSTNWTFEERFCMQRSEEECVYYFTSEIDKTLYGLSDSPQAFYDDISIYLLKNGYKRTGGGSLFVQSW
jgi:hypothetical protein